VTVTQGCGDAQLLSALGEGDMAALRCLYDRHAPWLSVRLARRCNDAEIVSDVLQDTFVAVWRTAAAYRGEGEVAAWLCIAVRRLVSRVRRRRDLVVLADVPERPDARTGVEEQVLLDIEYGDVGAALAELSPEMRAVMQARSSTG